MINLIYIRAAIRERTGQELSLETVRDLLLEEGLITEKQAHNRDLIFRGYAEYFDTEESATRMEDPNPFIVREIEHEDD
mgnify:FL=1|jgi:hypothetical protein|tara:strand:- start:3 stop:239 length:237 start_codon:yes stop_codon:yes gene_type:complete